jgi:ankyrin repeat protein
MISNSHIYLHKAIRLRDPVLTEKLINMGISVDACDDQGKKNFFFKNYFKNIFLKISLKPLGSTCFHVLFSSFTKQFYKCSLIGDILLRKNSKLNVMNNDSWAAIHIAARRASKECLLWIINQNKFLSSSSRETFDLNMRGKNKWTPLHLSVNGFRIVETILLLKAGCDVFAKNSDGKIPRKVANGNFLLTKLLRNYESDVLREKFPNEEKLNMINAHQICFTTVEDLSNIEDFNSFIIRNKILKEEKGLDKGLEKNEKFEKIEKNEIEKNEKNENRIFSPIMSGSEKEESLKSGGVSHHAISSCNNLPNMSLNLNLGKNSKNFKQLSCNETLKKNNLNLLLDDTIEGVNEEKIEKIEKFSRFSNFQNSQQICKIFKFLKINQVTKIYSAKQARQIYRVCTPQLQPNQ